MAKKMNYTSKSLLYKTFPKNVKGYDPLEVDKSLDQVIEDYKTYEKYYAESKDYIAKLETKINELSNENEKLKIENARLTSRIGNIKDDNTVSRENIDYIMRIRALEKFLYQHGFKPEDIK